MQLHFIIYYFNVLKLKHKKLSEIVSNSFILAVKRRQNNMDLRQKPFMKIIIYIKLISTNFLLECEFIGITASFIYLLNINIDLAHWKTIQIDIKMQISLKNAISNYRWIAICQKLIYKITKRVCGP